MYKLEDVKQITNEDELESIILKVMDYKTGLVLEHMKADDTRQAQIKKEIAEIDAISEYITSKLEYKTR